MNTEHLRNADLVIKGVVDEVGLLPALEKRPILFTSLARIIVGQQLSAKASRTIFRRLTDEIDIASTSSYLSTPREVLLSVGLSSQKEGYIRGIAQKIENDELNWLTFKGLSDDYAREVLTSIRGLGQWSADMFLIFDLQRPNIFSSGDTGLKRAICSLYAIGHEEYLDKIPSIVERWTPYKSTASRYLWFWLDKSPIL